MFRKSPILLCIIVIFGISAYCQEPKTGSRIYPEFIWKADILHSSISFRTMHWGIVEIIGWFEEYDVTLKKVGDAWETSEFKIVINPKSVRLPNMGMASNLQGEAFFDSGKFPEIVFESKTIAKKSDSTYVATGDLTIKETTRSIDWEIKFNGDVLRTPGFTATGYFTLEEFNINTALDSLGDKFVDVGDTVFIRCNFRLEIEGY